MQYTKNDFEMIRLLWTAFRHAGHDAVTLDEESYSTPHCKTVSEATYKALTKLLPHHLLKELMEHHELDLIIDQLTTKGRLYIRRTPDGTNGQWVEDYKGGIDKFEADQAEVLEAVEILGKTLRYEIVKVNGWYHDEQWEYLRSRSNKIPINNSLLSVYYQVLSCDPNVTL